MDNNPRLWWYKLYLSSIQSRETQQWCGKKKKKNHFTSFSVFSIPFIPILIGTYKIFWYYL